MSSVPISIIKYRDETLYGGGKIRFQIIAIEKGSGWNRSHSCDLNELKKFRDEISAIIDSLSFSDQLGVDENIGDRIETANKTDEICQGCKFKKSKQCVTCLFELQSPLERRLYSQLLEHSFYFKVQYAINIYGKQANLHNQEEKDLRLKYTDLLTQADFYFPNSSNPVCVYTDGHTYHERTEEQAKRDRSIDRKLQELGYVVLRFTGKEINETMPMVINQIKKITGMKN